MKNLPFTATGRLTVLAILLVATVALAGWVATGALCEQARQDIVRDGEALALTISIHLNSECDRIRGGVRALAGSPWITPALVGGSAIDLAHANTILDRYNASLNVTVSYLLDLQGLAIASSNRHAPNSYAGRFFSHQPHFREALQGLGGEDFSVGRISGRRAFYASFPVRDPSGRIVGVAAMRKDLDIAESFFSKYPHCYFVDPHGIVFLASRPDMVLKSLWPVTEKAAAELSASRQFGKSAFEAVFPEEVVDGTEVSLEGEGFLVSRRIVTRDGWSVVLLNSTNRVQALLTAGAMATAAVLALFLAVLAVMFTVNRSRQTIALEEERFRELFGNMSSGVLVYEAREEGKDFVIRDVNRAAERLSRIRRGEVIGRSVLEVFPAIREMGLLEVIERVWKTGDPERLDVTRYRDERISQWVENYVYRLPTGEVVAVYDDVSDRQQAEEALRRSEEKYREILENMQESYLETDLAGNLTFFNPSLCGMLGYPPGDFPGMHYRKLLDEESVPKVREAFRRVHQTGIGLRLLECRMLRKDGTPIHVETSLMLMRDDAGKAVGYSGIARDISERKRFEEELRRQSVSDALTGLFNRRGFLALAEQQLKIAGRSRMEIVLLFADMDGLKWINDNLGHRKGDEAIVEAAAALKDAFRDSDIVARVGGDEFVVLLLGTSLDNSTTLTGRLQECLDARNTAGERDYRLSISVGMVRCNPEETRDIDELMSRADALMYEQKKQKKAQRA